MKAKAGSSRYFDSPLFRRAVISTKVYRCADNVETSGRAAISTTRNFDKYPVEIAAFGDNR